MISVILPERSMRMKAFGAKTSASPASPAAAPANGIENPSNNPPPAAALALRKARRLRVALDIMAPRMIRSCRLRRALDRLADPQVGAAAADVAGHGLRRCRRRSGFGVLVSSAAADMICPDWQ